MEKPTGPLNLNAMKRDLLVLLARMDQPSGREVHAELDSEYEDVMVYNTVSGALKELEADGYVRSERREEDERNKQYELTPFGVRSFEADLEWRDRR